MMKTFQGLTLTFLTTLTLTTQVNAGAPTELTINPTVDATVSSTLVADTIHKTGANKLTLTGSNTIGTLDIQAGTVSVGAVTNLKATPAAVSFTTADGGKLAVTATTGVINADVTDRSGIFDIATGTTTTLSSLTGGAGKTLDKQGAGTLAVDGVADNSGVMAGIKVTDGTLLASGADSLTALTTLNGGTLALAADVTTAREIAMAANSSVSVAAGTATLGGAAGMLTGGLTLTKTGGGTLALSGDKAAATTAFKVDAGTLSISAASQLPVGEGVSALTLNGGQLTVGAGMALPLAIAVTNDSTIDTTGAVTQANALTNIGGFILTKSGTGSLAVTYEEGIADFEQIRVTAGSLIAAAANQLPAVTTLNGGTLELGNGVTTIREIAVGASNGSVAVAAAETATLGGTHEQLTGGNRITKTGNGTLVLTGNKSAATTGFTVDAGTLRAGADNVFPAGGSPALTLNNTATLDITGAYTIPVPIAVAEAATSYLNTNGNAVTHSAALTGAGTLAKTGAGTLTLNASASRAASTTAITVSGGTLSVGATTDLPGGVGAGLTLAAGTTLITTGAVTPPKAITLTGNATLNAGATTTISNGLSGAFTLTKSGVGDLVVSSDISAVPGITVSDASTYIAQAATALPVTVTLADGATLSLTTGGTPNAAPVTNTVLVGAGNTATLSGTATGFNAEGQLHTISKTGAGTLALTGDKSASTSVISVAAGELRVANATNFPAAVTVAAGTTLTTTGTVDAFGGVIDSRTINMATGSTLKLGGNWAKAITVGAAT